MITNQNWLKFKGNTLSHNMLKDLVPSMSLYLSFRQLSKPVKNPNSATTTKSDTNIKKHCKLCT